MKRTPIRPISTKMAAQLKKERALKEVLIERCGYLCEKCHKPPDWRGLSKHEIKSRAQGGDPLDPSSCLMLCGKCHSAGHHIKELDSVEVLG